MVGRGRMSVVVTLETEGTKECLNLSEVKSFENLIYYTEISCA